MTADNTTDYAPGRVPRILLHLEGLALFISAIALYALQGFDGWAFVILLLVPDFSALGYLVDKRIGSYSYNLFHTTTLPLALLVLSYAAAWQAGLMLGLVWLAHIGMDRAIGYGLKYASAFKETHLQRV